MSTHILGRNKKNVCLDTHLIYSLGKGFLVYVLAAKTQISLSICSEGHFTSKLYSIAPDKREYTENIFLITPGEHILWVLIRSGSMRHF